MSLAVLRYLTTFNGLQFCTHYANAWHKVLGHLGNIKLICNWLVSLCTGDAVCVSRPMDDSCKNTNVITVYISSGITSILNNSYWFLIIQTTKFKSIKQHLWPTYLMRLFILCAQQSINWRPFRMKKTGCL